LSWHKGKSFEIQYITGRGSGEELEVFYDARVMSRELTENDFFDIKRGSFNLLQKGEA
jgi:hypothetical protein